MTSQRLSSLLVSEPHIMDAKITLTDGDKLTWEKVPGASYYLLKLPATKLLEENFLLGCNTSTSVEIPYSSLTFKNGIKKRPPKVKTVVEVWAFGNSRIIGNGTRYTNVGMYESYTSFSSKRKISSLFYRGEKFMFILYLDPIPSRVSESVPTSTALRVRGLQRFCCVGSIGRAVIVLKSS